jgi:ribosome recycling factor
MCMIRVVILFCIKYTTAKKKKMFSTITKRFFIQQQQLATIKTIGCSLIQLNTVDILRYNHQNLLHTTSKQLLLVQPANHHSTVQTLNYAYSKSIQYQLLSSAAASKKPNNNKKKNNDNNDETDNEDQPKNNNSNNNRLDTQTLLLNGKKEMKDALDRLEIKLKQLRTGGAEADMLDTIMITLSGGSSSNNNKKIPLSQLATVSAPSPKLLAVTVMDEQHVSDVCKAISSNSMLLNLVPQLVPSGTGSSSSSSNNVIHVAIPKTTKEQREARVKLASEATESAKQSIRNIRNQINTKLKNDKQLPEDEKKRTEKNLQTMTDAANAKAEERFKSKEKELLTVVAIGN